MLYFCLFSAAAAASLASPPTVDLLFAVVMEEELSNFAGKEWRGDDVVFDAVFGVATAVDATTELGDNSCVISCNENKWLYEIE